MEKKRNAGLFALCFFFALFGSGLDQGVCLAFSVANTVPSWTIDYIIDNDETFDAYGSQNAFPRSNRGLALSRDGNYVYLSYGQTQGNDVTTLGEVRKVNLNTEDDEDATEAFIRLPRVSGLNWPKGLATDDAGRVYMAQGAQIGVYDDNISGEILAITGMSNSEGVCVVRKDADEQYVYVGQRHSSQIARFILDENTLTAGLDLAFGTGGFLDLGLDAYGNPTNDVRGLEVDADGRIWIAENDGTLFRVSADLATIDRLALTYAFDVAINGNEILVTYHDDGDATSRLYIVDGDLLSLIAQRSIPWGTLGLDPDGESEEGTLSGIDILPGEAIFIANEKGQTWPPAPNPDDDDNEPLLRLGEYIPEPAGLPATLLGIALLSQFRRRKRFCSHTVR